MKVALLSGIGIVGSFITIELMREGFTQKGVTFKELHLWHSAF